MSSNTPAPSRKLRAAAAADQSFACLRCKKRKSFCTRDKPKCQSCCKGKRECIYPTGKRTVAGLEAQVAELQARIEAYEGLSPSQVPSETLGNPLSTPASDGESDFEIQPLAEGLDNLVISPSGHHQYLGRTSSTILSRRLRGVVGMAGSSGGVLQSDQEVATYSRDALRLRRVSSVDETIEIPPYPTAQRYFAAQYSMIGTIFAFVLPDAFEHHLQLAYLGEPDHDDQESCLAHCQVLMILAFGQLYEVNQWTSSKGPPGFGYFTQALQYLPDIHEEPSVIFCGVLALIGYFMQNLNRRDAAFLYVGLAQRMAISLAMHEEASVPGLSESDKEMRRRTFWSIYSLDRILCVKYGNPVTMHDEDIKVDLPERLPQEAEYCPAIVLKHYTLLSRILGQIMRGIYHPAPKSGSVLMGAVQDIMSALAEWERNIPDQLRFERIRTTASREHLRESISTFLHYYQCINMTVRPLLFHVVEKRLKTPWADRPTDWKDSLSNGAVSVIEQCIFAARATTSMMSAAADRDLIAVFGYMDGEHAFSAAMILVMVCVALPFDEANTRAMDEALAVLETMAAKGNHHIAARRLLLVELRSVIARREPLGQPIDASGMASLNAPVAQLESQPLFTSQAPMLSGLDDMAWSEMFDGDQTMFEAAYRPELTNMEFDLDSWTHEVGMGIDPTDDGESFDPLEGSSFADGSSDTTCGETGE